MRRRIFISSPRDEHLDDRRNKLKWAIVREIEAKGYEAQAFGTVEGGMGLAAGISWNPKEADQVIRRCIGAAVLGFPIWRCSALKDGRAGSLVTEYCHYEGALARTYGLPILAVLEQGVDERVFFNRYGSDAFIRPPSEADHTWVTESGFRSFLEGWHKRLGERRDVFLAYSGKLETTASGIKEVLNRIGATVLDWKHDFVAGLTILQQVEQAAKRTSGGVFLFTRDDMLEGEAGQAAPRDNVIFEAGFFAHSKGHERVLIIREAGAKMPADLGGVVYETLLDRSDVGGLEERLRKFVEAAI